MTKNTAKLFSNIDHQGNAIENPQCNITSAPLEWLASKDKRQPTKNPNKTSVGKMQREGNPDSIYENVNQYRKQYGNSIKMKIRPYDPAIPLRNDIITKLLCQENICMPIFIAALLKIVNI